MDTVAGKGIPAKNTTSPKEMPQTCTFPKPNPIAEISESTTTACKAEVRTNKLYDISEVFTVLSTFRSAKIGSSAKPKNGNSPNSSFAFQHMAHHITTRRWHRYLLYVCSCHGGMPPDAIRSPARFEPVRDVRRPEIPELACYRWKGGAGWQNHPQPGGAVLHRHSPRPDVSFIRCAASNRPGKFSSIDSLAERKPRLMAARHHT